jgi:long-chain acyl-CoA synthetase
MVKKGRLLMDRIWLKSWPQGMAHRLDFPERPLHAFLKDHARQSPDRPAIQYYGRRISFGELDEQSDRLAAALADFGLKKGDRVSLFLENCPQFVIAYYAVLKGGGIVVAANPMFKEDELRHEILDSGAKIIFTLDHLYPKVKAVKDGTPLTHEIVTSYWDYLPAEPVLPVHPSMKVEKVVSSSRRDRCPRRPGPAPVHLGNNRSPERRHDHPPQSAP